MCPFHKITNHLWALSCISLDVSTFIYSDFLPFHQPVSSPAHWNFINSWLHFFLENSETVLIHGALMFINLSFHCTYNPGFYFCTCVPGSSRLLFPTESTVVKDISKSAYVLIHGSYHTVCLITSYLFIMKKIIISMPR